MITVSASEFQRNIGRYQDEALKQAVAITSNGRERVVMVSAEEYRKALRYMRESIPVGELTDAEVKAMAELEASL
jgi:prevent-host-death family protein